MSYLLRVVMPDRPGSLGAVATAIGVAGGDIVGLDVVEHRRDGRAVDDVLVALPSGRLPDGLVSACLSVDGVEVEFVGHYSPGAHLHRDLEAVEAMTAEPAQAEDVLVDLVPGVFRSGWAVLVADEGGTVTVLRASTGAPRTDLDPTWLPLTGPRRLAPRPGWSPESWHDVEAVAVPVGSPHRAIVFGRDGGPRILDSELARLTHLVALAGVIAAAGASTDADDQPMDASAKGRT
jgi:hypothetical protein